MYILYADIPPPPLPHSWVEENALNPIANREFLATQKAEKVML